MCFQFPLEESQVLLLLERVTDAQRQATRQLKESDEKRNKRSKRKSGEQQLESNKRRRSEEN